MEKQQSVPDHIQNAGTVQLVAVGNTIPVALDGAFKLNKIGIRAAAWGCQQSRTCG